MTRAWANILVIGLYLTGVGLAAAFFIALGYLTGSKWWVALRRVPEALTAVLIPGCALVLAALAFGDLYRFDGLTGFKGWWLDYSFFLARAAAYVGIWIALTRALVKRPGARISAVFVVAFAITVSLASFDWLMALDPHFVSTLFGVYQFAGLFQSGLAAIILLAAWTERQRAGFRLRPDHLHDLGKLLFAFSTFWMYIWFSQYMLVWYANLSEEAGYFAARTRGGWGTAFLLSMVLNWCVPFVVLLPKRTKKDAAMLARVAGVVLIGRYIDLYVAVMPKPPFGPLDLAVAAAGAGLLWLVFRNAIARAPLVPVSDPGLRQSLSYHS